ncbi:MAG: formate/nitrite transporter family protein [Clostridiales Family XIII bacterium]|nr:formate/nitrite transporter family protein [Clostridiales Family XIII bacterium]
MSDIKTPSEISKISIETAIAKADAPFLKLAILGFLAGAFVAFAAEGSNMAAFGLLADPGTYGLGRLVAGAVFPTGLMLIVIAGGELFTGNTLMLAAAFERRITVGKMLRNWAIVYAMNLVGSLFIAYVIYKTGLLSAGNGELGGVTIKIAAAKANLSFSNAFLLGIFCNWLVCLAVWMAFATKSMTGKLFAIFFPIMLFVASGFEHCIANMYYIPAGIFAAGNQAYLDSAFALGLSADALSGLDYHGFFAGNLLPVTLGNIVGGGIFVAMAYLFAYREQAGSGGSGTGKQGGTGR